MMMMIMMMMMMMMIMIMMMMIMMMMMMMQVLLSWLEDLPHQPGQGARSPHRQRMLTNGSFVKVKIP